MGEETGARLGKEGGVRKDRGLFVFILFFFFFKIHNYFYHNALHIKSIHP